MRKYALAILLLAAVNFVHVMDFMIIMPLNPFLKDSLGINTKEFGLLVSAFTLSAGIFALISAPIVEKYDRKYALLFLFAGFIIGTLGCGLSDSYSQLLIFRIVAGAFGGMAGTMVMSIVGDTVPIEYRSKAMSWVMMSFSLSSIIGMPVGLYLADLYDWQAPFILIAILSVIVFIIAFIGLPSVKDHLNDLSKDTSRPLKVFEKAILNSNQRNGLILMFLLIMGQFTMIPFISDFSVNNLGILKGDLMYIYLFGGIATTISMPIIGWISDKYPRKNIFAVMALLSFVPMYLLPQMDLLTVQQLLMITVPFFIFISSRMIPATTLITSVVEPKERAGYMSINTAMREFAAALATFIGAQIIIDVEGQPLENYDIVSYVAIVSSILAIWYIRKLKIVA